MQIPKCHLNLIKQARGCKGGVSKCSWCKGLCLGNLVPNFWLLNYSICISCCHVAWNNYHPALILTNIPCSIICNYSDVIQTKPLSHARITCTTICFVATSSVKSKTDRQTQIWKNSNIEKSKDCQKSWTHLISWYRSSIFGADPSISYSISSTNLCWYSSFVCTITLICATELQLSFYYQDENTMIRAIGTEWTGIITQKLTVTS